MDTTHVTRADQGEHWLVGTDLTTIEASGLDTYEVPNRQNRPAT